MYNVFFFKQKTEYEMLRSRVGSEMCIRDRDEWGAIRRGNTKDRDARGSRDYGDGSVERAQDPSGNERRDREYGFGVR